MSVELNQELSIQTLSEHLIFSNTPIYLYSKFRKDPSVQRLANSHKTEELISVLDQFEERRSFDVSGAAKLFAVLTAFSFKPLVELGNLGSRSAQHPWFEAIKRMVMEDAPKDFRLNIQIPSKPRVAVRQEEKTAVSNSMNFTTAGGRNV